MKLLRGVSSSLKGKLFASHMLVTVVGAFTFLVAVSLIAPAIFGNLTGGMMGQDRMTTMAQMADSVYRAFEQTLLYSLLVAALTAAVTAAVASLFVARRITEPLGRMLEATRRIATGRYAERVPVEESDELGALSESFNAMAATLEANEKQRRDNEKQRREFVSDVSHELGTPLSTLQGYMIGLMDGIIEPSEETWALLYAEADRMRRLAEDLGQLSRTEAGRLDLRVLPAPPEELVGRAVEGLLPLYKEKGVRLESVASEKAPPVLADADRTVQVLTNLLSNALRHTPEGGRVSVEVDAQDEDVLFRISDTGAGIAPEHLPRVFERFYRIEKSRSREGGGSGLGLAISRALVEAMDGRIWAESEGPDKGALFTFTLPAAPREHS